MKTATFATCCGLLVFVGAAGPALGQETRRVSVDSTGIQGDFHSVYPALSGDGRFVAFDSVAHNLVPGDTNGARDVFVHAPTTGITTRVSVSSSGVEGDAESFLPAISADGTFVAFVSDATNLVPGDTNGKYDVFVRNLLAGTTVRVSVDSAGVESNGDSSYEGPSISADGRYVVFTGYGTNLVPFDTNQDADVFVHDCLVGSTIRASVNNSGVEGDSYSLNGSITPDGRYVVFQSQATNLVVGDTNAHYDVFRRDLVTGRTLRVSVDSSGVQGNSTSWMPSINADGSRVAFASQSILASDDTGQLWDIYVRDIPGRTTEKVSVSSAGRRANNDSLDPVITPDGRYVAFQSEATNLVADDDNGSGDVFLRDLRRRTTISLSVNPTGVPGHGGSYAPSISDDADGVAFTSSANDLVPADTNAAHDVFVRPVLRKVLR